jgi:hypothetical protein
VIIIVRLSESPSLLLLRLESPWLSLSGLLRDNIWTSVPDGRLQVGVDALGEVVAIRFRYDGSVVYSSPSQWRAM